MKYTVNITRQAKSDLRGIFEYIAFELAAPENAAGQMERLEKNIMELSFMPYRFREYDSELWKSKGLRIMPVDNFVVLYVPNEKSATVTVLRVMYGGRDIDAQLEKHTDRDV